MKTKKIWRIAFMMLAAFSSPLAAAMMTISLMQANLKVNGEKLYEVVSWTERR